MNTDFIIHISGALIAVAVLILIRRLLPAKSEAVDLVRDEAERIYESQKNYHSRGREWVEVNPADISDADFAGIYRVRDAFIADGYRVLGMVEDKTQSDFTGWRIPILALIDQTGAIVVGVWDETGTTEADVAIDLTTEFYDGSFLITFVAVGTTGRLPCPGIRWNRCPADTTPEELIRLHASACADYAAGNSRPTPRRFVGLEDTLESDRRAHALRRRYRESIGYIDEQIMKALQGVTALTPRDRAIVDEIQRLHRQSQA